MKKTTILMASLIFLTTLIKAQEKKEEKDFGIKFSGFVKGDFFYDTRQTKAAREGHFLLWPLPETNDVNNDDINAKPNFNFLAVQTRLKGTITGPDAFGAKTSGAIEGAFFGHSSGDENGFRLRHAFVNFDWGSTRLLFGQYWSPMFVTGCFPGVVSFNTGVPFQPFSRNPQIRLTKSMGDLKLMIAALSQRDFASSGGSEVLRNSGVPDMHLQVHYGSQNNETGTGFLAGIGAEYKTIVPRLASTDTSGASVKVEESVGSMAAMAFCKVKLNPVTIKVEGIYGQNLTDLLMIGGYAVTDTDPVTGKRDYAPTNTMSTWIDVHTNGKKIQAGLFGGFSQNMGTDEDITGSIYGLGTNIESILRISPRVIFNSGSARFAGELEYTSAAFGTPDANGIPDDPTSVANLRFLLGVYYFF
jgi:hypothetical protein